MDIQVLLSLAIIHTVALISPGPDFALIVQMASQESRKTALASAIGISVAILFHTLFGLTGISMLIKNSTIIFIIVQITGASYLGWSGLIAIKVSILNRQKTLNNNHKNFNLNKMTSFDGFKKGLYTNLLNPKAMVFFITLFSAIITPEISLITKIFAVIILFFLSLFWFILIALFLSKPIIQQKIKKANSVISAVTGILFISVAFFIFSNLL
ncbi:MAG: LysE family transporter [Colwellia sp.]